MRKVAVLCGALMFVGACGDGPTMPSGSVDGTWDFSFSAFDQASCTANSPLMRGCAGSGRLEFLRTRPVDARHSFRASCQACDGASDYGVVEQALGTARVTGSMLEFSLSACRFAAMIPSGRTTTIDGTITCRPSAREGREVRGGWTMSRR